MKFHPLNREDTAPRQTPITKYFTAIAALILLATATACGQAPAQNNVDDTPDTTTQPLPEGAIPFDYNSHLYFDAVIRDSIPAKLLFDTGATNLLIDSTFYAEHFAAQGTLRRGMIGGAGDGRQVTYLDISKWPYKIGEYATTENSAIVLNLRKIVGNNVSGMFGMDFMRGRKVEFNYADKYIRILGDEQPDTTYTCIDCKWLDNTQTRILVPLTLTLDATTTREGIFLVDMGSSGTLSINSSSVAKLGLQGRTDVQKMVYNVGGIGGSRTDYLFKLASVKVGGLNVSDVRADYSGNSTGSLADKRYDGLIGNELLERFDVIFDFAECKMWVRPNRNFDKPNRYFFGVALTPQKDCWIVNGLVEGGKAEKAGVKRGDRIVAINGKTPNEMSEAERKALTRSREPWRATIDRNGTTTEIVIECED